MKAAVAILIQDQGKRKCQWGGGDIDK